MKIILGSDHAGFILKSKILKFLQDNNYEVVDKGAFSEDPVDYPLQGFEVAKEVSRDKKSLGIVICGSGIGISIACNRNKNVRCALCYNTKLAELSRLHNGANVLALGGRFIADWYAIEIVKTFLNTQPSTDERHLKRIKMLGE